MKPSEIIKANMRHTGPKRVGMTFNGGRMNDMVPGTAGHPAGYTQRRWVEGDFEYYDDMWGNIWYRAVNGCTGGEIFTPALADWAQLTDFRMPVYDYQAVVNSYREAFAAGGDKFKLAGMPGWIFASARYLRKLEDYLMDMLLYPDELKILHARLGEFLAFFIRAAGEAKADGIFFCEDMGTQTGLLFSPQLWDEYFRELYTKLFGLAHENGLLVCMHSCGQNREILEPLLKAGVDCFQFDQPTVYDPVELSTLLRRYKAALWSPVDIQKILPTGDYELIRAGIDAMFQYYEGFLIFKNYTDLKGIGVKPEWDQFAYETISARLNPK